MLGLKGSLWIGFMRLLFSLAVLGIKPRIFYLLGKCFATEKHPSQAQASGPNSFKLFLLLFHRRGGKCLQFSKSNFTLDSGQRETKGKKDVGCFLFKSSMPRKHGREPG